MEFVATCRNSIFCLEESNKKNPFPCPTTYRTALLHYVDISGRAKGNILQGLIEYAQDPKDKEFLEKLTKNDEEGKVCLVFAVFNHFFPSICFAQLLETLQLCLVMGSVPIYLVFCVLYDHFDMAMTMHYDQMETMLGIYF